MAEEMHVVTGNKGTDIQDSIKLAHDANGGVVFLPARVYTLSGPLQLNSNVSLVGAGHQTVLRMALSTAINVNFIELVGDEKGIHDIQISHLAIEGPGTSNDLSQGASAQAAKGCGILALDQPVHNVVVDRCRIKNVSGCGMYFRISAKDQLMRNITVRNCTLLDNRRPNDRTPHGPDAYKDIYFNGVQFENIQVEGNVCTFTPNGTSHFGNDSGIAFVINAQNRKGFARNVRLVGNVCSGHRRHGLVTNYDTLDVDWAFVSDNRCQNNGWAGIYVNTHRDRAANARVVVSGNYCSNNGFVGHDTSDDKSIRGGIVVNDADNLIVSKNICMDNGKPGPTFAAHGVVAGTNAVHASGIRIRGQEMIVEGNLVQGNEGSGVMMWPARASRVSITNNRAVENGHRGIEVAGESVNNQALWAKQVVVTDNLCDGNKKIGILVSATDGALVAANYVFHNGEAGISLDSRTQNVSVQRNYIVATSTQQLTIGKTDGNFIGDNTTDVQ